MHAQVQTYRYVYMHNYAYCTYTPNRPDRAQTRYPGLVDISMCLPHSTVTAGIWVGSGPLLCGAYWCHPVHSGMIGIVTMTNAPQCKIPSLFLYFLYHPQIFTI